MTMGHGTWRHRAEVLLVAGTMVLLWEATVVFCEVPDYVVPAPSAVFGEITREFDLLLRHTAITVAEAGLGFLAANVLAVFTAVLFVHVPFLERVVFPSFVTLQSIPIVAFAPLIGLWFGEGLLGKVIMAALITIFPMVVNATTGLRAVDREAIDLMRTLSASRYQILMKLRFPSSLPFIISALRISGPLAVVGAIVAELSAASSGIGYLILVAAYRVETVRLFACLFFAAAAGIMFFGIARVAELLVRPKSKTGLLDTGKIWQYIRDGRTIPDDLLRRCNNIRGLELKRQARPSDFPHIERLAQSGSLHARLLAYALLHNFAARTEGFTETDRSRSLRLLKKSWQRAEDRPAGDRRAFEERMGIMWPLLDGIGADDEYQQRIFDFIQDNWEAWRNRTMQYYADEDGRLDLERETMRKLADPRYPASKKWVYLHHASIIDEDKAAALAREWTESNPDHILRDRVAERFIKDHRQRRT